MAPLRAVAAELACTEYAMVAGPVPLAGGFTCTKDALLPAVQVHPERPVSAKLPFCACAETVADIGLTAKLQGGPAWLIVTLCDPTVIVPDRVGSLLLTSTVKPALPFPVPVCPNTIVIQLADVLTFLTQVLELAAICSVPLPPASGKELGVAVRVKV